MRQRLATLPAVIPAQAGIHASPAAPCRPAWTPIFIGVTMTVGRRTPSFRRKSESSPCSNCNLGASIGAWTLGFFVVSGNALTMKQPCVYMLTNRRNGTLYTGVTANLPQRLEQHRTGKGSSFVCRYGLSRLVWYEIHDEMLTAIAREKQIKEWKRTWKVELIEDFNPGWIDLWETLNQ